jgi:hypothetical protein
MPNNNQNGDNQKGNNHSHDETRQYGLDAVNFALALSGTVTVCLLVGGLIISASDYDDEAARLCGKWFCGSAALTWLCLLFAHKQ